MKLFTKLLAQSAMLSYSGVQNMRDNKVCGDQTEVLFKAQQFKKLSSIHLPMLRVTDRRETSLLTDYAQGASLSKLTAV